MFQQPTLRMALQAPYFMFHKAHTVVPLERIILPLAALPRFCGILSDLGVLERCAIRYMYIPPSTRRRWKDDFVFCLEELHQTLMHVDVTEIGSKSIGSRAADSIPTYLTHIDQVFDGISAYKLRARREPELCETRNTYLNALDYLTWLFSNAGNKCIMRLDGCNDETYTELLEIGMTMTFEFAEMCINLGDFDCARQRVGQSFAFWLDSSARTHYKPDIDYWYALARIGKGEINSGIFHFLQALASRPGNQLYDAAVDKLEEHLEASSREEEEDMIALRNVQAVLQPFRHQAD